MYQFKPFKQSIYYRNKQLDGMNKTYDDNNAFSITLPSPTSNKTTIWI